MYFLQNNELGLLQINGYAKFVSSFLCKKGIFKHFLVTFLKELRVAVNLKQARPFFCNSP